MTDDNLIVLAAIREVRRLESLRTDHPSMRLAAAGTPLPVAAGGRARRRPLTETESSDGDGEVGA